MLIWMDWIKSIGQSQALKDQCSTQIKASTVTEMVTGKIPTPSVMVNKRRTNILLAKTVHSYPLTINHQRKQAPSTVGPSRKMGVLIRRSIKSVPTTISDDNQCVCSSAPPTSGLYSAAVFCTRAPRPAAASFPPSLCHE